MSKLSLLFFSLSLSFPLPPPCLFTGYVQSLIRRVVNNLNVVINNLILKYVEDDIVLSVNITSAECYTVDEQWDRAFIDVICEFTDAVWLCVFSLKEI